MNPKSTVGVPGFTCQLGRCSIVKNEPLSIQREFLPVINRLKSHYVAAAAIAAPQGALPPEWLDVEALERRLPIGKGSLIILDTPMPGKWEERQQFLYSMFLAGGAATLPVAQSWAQEQFIPPENELLMFAYNYQDESAQNAAVHCERQLAVDPDLFPLAAWKRLQEINRRLGCELFEGLVAKRVDSIYPLQLRSPNIEFPFWMKHRWSF